MPNRLNVNNEYISDKDAIINNFNKYFTEIGPNLAKKIPSTNENCDQFLEGNYPSLHEENFTYDEIKTAIDSLKPNSSPGFDEINPKIIKLVYPSIQKPLKFILNLSLKTGCFPDQLNL